jgi:CBS domain-containing protein
MTNSMSPRSRQPTFAANLHRLADSPKKSYTCKAGKLRDCGSGTTTAEQAMHISDVLAAKGHRVETVSPSQAVRGIPKIFVDRQITSVVVATADGRPVGMITDRHLLTALAHNNGSLGPQFARDIMTSPAPACLPGDDLVAVLKRMTHERVRHLVVMDGDQLTGLVSIGDLVKHRFQDTDLEMRVLRDLALAHMTA